MMKAFKPLAVAIAFAAFSITPATATTIVYDNETAYLNNGGLDNVLVDFEGPDPYPRGSLIFSPITLNGVTITPQAGVPAPNLYIFSPSNSSVPGNSWLSANGDEAFDITLGTPVNAAAFTYYQNTLGGAIITVFDELDNELTSITVGSGAVNYEERFFGVTSTSLIGRLNFVSTLGAVINTGIDNIRIGYSQAVPAPGALALLGIGLLGLGVRRRTA